MNILGLPEKLILTHLIKEGFLQSDGHGHEVIFDFDRLKHRIRSWIPGFGEREYSYVENQLKPYSKRTMVFSNGRYLEIDSFRGGKRTKNDYNLYFGLSSRKLPINDQDPMAYIVATTEFKKERVAASEQVFDPLKTTWPDLLKMWGEVYNPEPDLETEKMISHLNILTEFGELLSAKIVPQDRRLDKDTRELFFNRARGRLREITITRTTDFLQPLGPMVEGYEVVFSYFGK